jgi:hypothetical protein
MKTRTAALLAMCAAAALAARPAAAQADTTKAVATDTAHAAPAAPVRVRRNPNLITRAEIDARGLKNALDAVRTLRGSWLRPSRALSSVNDATPVVAVYRDGTLVGGPDALDDIGVDTIVTIQFLSPREAVQRFGGDISGGAILVNSH